VRGSGALQRPDLVAPHDLDTVEQAAKPVAAYGRGELRLDQAAFLAEWATQIIRDMTHDPKEGNGC
jgi:hypothetical protein